MWNYWIGGATLNIDELHRVAILKTVEELCQRAGVTRDDIFCRRTSRSDCLVYRRVLIALSLLIVERDIDHGNATVADILGISKNTVRAAIEASGSTSLDPRLVDFVRTIMMRHGLPALLSWWPQLGSVWLSPEYRKAAFDRMATICCRYIDVSRELVLQRHNKGCRYVHPERVQMKRLIMWLTVNIETERAESSQEAAYRLVASALGLGQHTVRSSYREPDFMTADKQFAPLIDRLCNAYDIG